MMILAKQQQLQLCSLQDFVGSVTLQLSDPKNRGPIPLQETSLHLLPESGNEFALIDLFVMAVFKHRSLVVGSW